MKPRAFTLHPGESASMAIGRLHKYVRQLNPNHQPKSRYAVQQQMKKAQRYLRLVK